MKTLSYRFDLFNWFFLVSCIDPAILHNNLVSLNWQAAFIGAMAIADLVKTTLGPKGMVCSLVLDC